jgi:hypothetical protein
MSMSRYIAVAVEMVASLLALVRAPGELAEAQAAVSEQRAQTQFLGQG